MVVETGKGRHLSNMVERPVFRELYGISRKFETALSRLRIGHAGVNKHLNRFNMRDSGQCTQCRVEDTVEHFLMHCRRYEVQRRIFGEKLQGLEIQYSIQNCLGLNNVESSKHRAIIMALKSFLTQTHRISEL